MNYQYFASPIGRLRLVSNGTHLLRIEFEGQYVKGPGEQATTDAVLDAASDQLTAYFGGRRQSFSLPTAAHGTVFQQTVWQALQDIPSGRYAAIGILPARWAMLPRCARWERRTDATRCPSLCPATGSSAAMAASPVLPAASRPKKSCYSWKALSRGMAPGEGRPARGARRGAPGEGPPTLLVIGGNGGDPGRFINKSLAPGRPLGAQGQR